MNSAFKVVCSGRGKISADKTTIPINLNALGFFGGGPLQLPPFLGFA